MKKKVLSLIAGGMVVAPTLGFAIGLGSVRTYSNLNERLSAEIPVLSVRKKGRMSVALAPNAVFAQRGVTRSQMLNNLRFSLVNKRGRSYVRVSSASRVKSPYLNFILELKGPEGTVYREYAIFLDPATPGAKKRKPVQPRTIKHSSTSTASKSSRTTPKSVATTPTKLNIIKGKSGRYGPVKRGETLWSIATHTRPSANIPVREMIAAIKQANPRTLARGLKAGSTIVIPAVSGYSAYQGGSTKAPSVESKKKPLPKTTETNKPVNGKIVSSIHEDVKSLVPKTDTVETAKEQSVTKVTPTVTPQETVKKTEQVAVEAEKKIEAVEDVKTDVPVTVTPVIEDVKVEEKKTETVVEPKPTPVVEEKPKTTPKPKVVPPKTVKKTSKVTSDSSDKEEGGLLAPLLGGLAALTLGGGLLLLRKKRKAKSAEKVVLLGDDDLIEDETSLEVIAEDEKASSDVPETELAVASAVQEDDDFELDESFDFEEELAKLGEDLSDDTEGLATDAVVSEDLAEKETAIAFDLSDNSIEETLSERQEEEQFADALAELDQGLEVGEDSDLDLLDFEDSEKTVEGASLDFDLSDDNNLSEKAELEPFVSEFTDEDALEDTLAELDAETNLDDDLDLDLEFEGTLAELDASEVNTEKKEVLPDLFAEGSTDLLSDKNPPEEMVFDLSDESVSDDADLLEFDVKTDLDSADAEFDKTLADLDADFEQEAAENTLDVNSVVTTDTKEALDDDLLDFDDTVFSESEEIAEIEVEEDLSVVEAVEPVEVEEEKSFPSINLSLEDTATVATAATAAVATTAVAAKTLLDDDAENDETDELFNASELVEQDDSEIELKFDLISTFLSLPNYVRARELLTEITDEGTPEQIERAKKMLKEIA